MIIPVRDRGGQEGLIVQQEGGKTMYTNILVPLDGSRLSEGILPYVRSIARASNAAVELLQIIEPEVVSNTTDPQHGAYVDLVEANLKQTSTEYLEEVARSFPNSFNVTCSAEIGNPAEVIVDRGSAHEDTLIAMSTHGRSGVQRWLLGSVADKVLHAATNPLFVLRSTDESKTTDEATLKTILVPLDGSLLAELVLPHVAAMAKKMKLEVELLRVYSVALPSYIDEGFTVDLQPLRENMKEEVKSYLDKKARQLISYGVDKVSTLVLEGDAPGEIIDMAREFSDNLVAICTHGRSGIGRWILGSVTDRIVRHCGDPVLIIRAKEEQVASPRFSPEHKAAA